ncbi:hypothetical protein EW026_g6535 [Hermanssonia centrifuga]|uniref:Serine protease inhibitor n=1 Tax=Hermanssonia centrifuga TaxID=98765 RepID=A0A4S4KAS3_9APHY|nr:hypothetical protein EW026_g6535 [Hermanssonia centrifuga]
MSLKEGNYIIRNRAQGQFIGRNLAEDLSLLPKKVINLPHGVQAPVWTVLPVNDSDNKYRFKIGGSYVAEIDHLLFAVLLEEPLPTEWRVTPSERDGPNAYIIEKVDRSAGWVLPEEEPYTQLAVRPLIIGASDPPYFPPTQLFEIIPFPEE